MNIIIATIFLFIQLLYCYMAIKEKDENKRLLYQLHVFATYTIVLLLNG